MYHFCSLFPVWHRIDPSEKVFSVSNDSLCTAAKPHKKCRLQKPAAFLFAQKKLLVFVFALLVCNTAGGLAGRLAGGLAFAASAGGAALLQVAGLNRLDSFHRDNLQSCKNDLSCTESASGSGGGIIRQVFDFMCPQHIIFRFCCQDSAPCFGAHPCGIRVPWP